MRLVINSLLLLVTLLISEHALARKSRAKESSPKVPVVAVVNLKVDSANEKVQKKIAELTDKVRDAVAAGTKNCKVITTKQMRSLNKRYAKKMASCYDDCDVEFGLLVHADFVIGGRLAPTAGSVITTIQIRDTRTRNVVASKKIEGNNYFDLEAALLAAMKRFVKPLNHVVYQAVDDEVLKDQPAETQAAGPADPFATNGAQAGGAAAANGESDYLAPSRQPVRQAPPTPLALRWEAHKDEPHFLKSDDLGFQKNKGGIFGVGVTIGYPFNVARAKELQNLYTPIFHVGLQLLARVTHILEIAVIVDFDYMSGKSTNNRRYGSPGLANCVDPDDFDQQNARQCFDDAAGAKFDYDYDNPANNFFRSNYYSAGSYFSLGVRPTIRLVLPINTVEAMIGAGIGINYVNTTGYWETHAAGNQFLRSSSAETVPVFENLAYDISMSGISFYGAFEAAVVFRLLGKRLGIGPYVEYKLPAMRKKGVDAKVTITNLNPNGEDSRLPDGSYSAFGPANDDPTTPVNEREIKKRDIIESPFGHTEMMNLLTIGLTADWRF